MTAPGQSPSENIVPVFFGPESDLYGCFNLIADYEISLLVFRFGVSFLVAMLLSGIQLELVIFERPRGRVFWVLTAVGVAMVVWAWTIPADESLNHPSFV